MTTATEAAEQFMAVAERLPSFWVLGQEWNAAIAHMEDPDADDDSVQAELERVAGDITQKAYGLAAVHQRLEQLADWQKAESRVLAERAKATQAHIERIERYALSAMQAAELPRIETGRFVLAVRLNNPKVEVLSEQQVPEPFWRHYEPPPPEVDKVAILAHWKATGGKSIPGGLVQGEPIPGCAIVRGERLEIR